MKNKIGTVEAVPFESLPTLKPYPDTKQNPHSRPKEGLEWGTRS
jgi:hypothetical protein